MAGSVEQLLGPGFDRTGLRVAHMVDIDSRNFILRRQHIGDAIASAAAVTAAAYVLQLEDLSSERNGRLISSGRVAWSSAPGAKSAARSPTDRGRIAAVARLAALPDPRRIW